MRYLDFGQTLQLSGLSERQLYRRLAELPRIKDPKDRRRRLIPVMDALELTMPVEQPPTKRSPVDSMAT